ncbi:hypothetical protein HO173_009739 [Letharia columbiana]|uniref:Uncharacterized protein n=1 Tax=Letharia columbiana TaxID=112416 RepID=A0A8H6L1D5_9LECA|nr:uncharacterized protein HO173_009739 [Letharia columbiana]KAF6231902.1 hypothetical protein HO173_009739 [Letharia columbiana]
MHLPLPSLTLSLTLLILTPPSLPLTLPPPPTLTNTTLTGAPIIGQPVCRRQPGGFTLVVCARLLTGLRTLPDYRKREIWSEYATGAHRLPVVFVQTDAATGRTCHLSMDLYGPGVPATASETFSLEGAQGDLNGIYFGCLKKYGTAGFARIGLHGNVAALLGPPLGEGSEEGGLAALRNGTRGARVMDMTEVGES